MIGMLVKTKYRCNLYRNPTMDLRKETNSALLEKNDTLLVMDEIFDSATGHKDPAVYYVLSSRGTGYVFEHGTDEA